MTRFLAVLFLLFAGPVFGQEKAPELPDYTKWDMYLTLPHLDYFVVKESQIGVLDLHFISQTGSEVVVLFKPVSEQTYKYVATLFQSQPPSEQINKTVISLLGKQPWLLFYSRDDESGEVYLYERTNKKWFEFYYFWKPRWRFVRMYDDDCTDGSCTANDEYEEFFSNRYGLEERY